MINKMVINAARLAFSNGGEKHFKLLFNVLRTAKRSLKLGDFMNPHVRLAELKSSKFPLKKHLIKLRMPLACG